jgi:hypothetical protein
MIKSATENDIRSILRESLVDPSPQSRELVSSTSVPIGMNAESIIGYASAGSTHLYKVKMLLVVLDTLLPTEAYSFVARSYGEDQRYVRALLDCGAVPDIGAGYNIAVGITVALGSFNYGYEKIKISILP